MLFRYGLIILMFGFIGCSSSLETNLDRVGRDYFPMEVGMYRMYDMQDTIYLLAGPDINHYQLRERVIDSTVLSSNGDSSNVLYTLERSVRIDENDRWKVDSIWTARVSSFRAVQTENNISYIKMAFPIERGLEWDGNALNALMEENYRYDNSLSDTVLFDQDYDQLWKVIQSEQLSELIGENFRTNRDVRAEVYARNVGLIIKTISIQVFQQPEEGQPAEIKIVAGRGLQQTLIEYGKE